MLPAWTSGSSRAWPWSSPRRALFIETLGLPLEGEGNDHSSGSVPGSKHFGLWPLSQAAESCFGTARWPAGRVVPQASIEFEVANAEAVSAAGAELQRAGFELVHQARTEPWGHTVARLRTAEGLIGGISYAPSLHDDSTPDEPGRDR
ncbi:glyoxalase [Streptomyces sp. NPDC050534]|uniref:glyoxalase n=1 Tax=Streptomyces sp. NPDC050534 TaxID=3365625 RepID=UPI0037930157